MNERVKPTILVTGATGFIGSALCAKLAGLNFKLIRAVRTGLSSDRTVVIGSIDGSTDWTDALQGVDTVIHCAARAHIMIDTANDPLQEFRKVNTEACLNLARQAGSMGVKRFIFLSSIKVNGEETPLGQPYTAEQVPATVDPYGISKREAEEALHELSRLSGMEIVIIRPPLVYGPGVKGNFQSMMNWLTRGIPLPLASIKNQRSLVAVDNLVDLIITCISHPAAANQTFLVSDGEDLSTPELLQRTASAIGRPARLFSVPDWLLRVAANVLGKKTTYQKLCTSLQVDIAKTRTILGWTPPVKLDQALQSTAKTFLKAAK
ncbi:MAG: SDR family oxidoreductase [Methylococcaceae bacterium]|nr:SDR family oxidoreductase [Methylococcaceae bacterium]